MRGVRACLTWKPLSVLTLMGRLKRGRVKALSLPPAPPGLQHSPGLEHSRIAKWGLDPPPHIPPKTPIQTPPSWGSCFSSSLPPPSHTLSLAPQTTTTTTPSHPSPSPPTVQSGPALLHLTSLAGAEQRPTRHQDNETGVQWLCEGMCVCLCESARASKKMCVRQCVSACTCVTAQP